MSTARIFDSSEKKVRMMDSAGRYATDLSGGTSYYANSALKVSGAEKKILESRGYKEEEEVRHD